MTWIPKCALEMYCCAISNKYKQISHLFFISISFQFSGRKHSLHCQNIRFLPTPLTPKFQFQFSSRKHSLHCQNTRCLPTITQKYPSHFDSNTLHFHILCPAYSLQLANAHPLHLPQKSKIRLCKLQFTKHLFALKHLLKQPKLLQIL